MSPRKLPCSCPTPQAPEGTGEPSPPPLPALSPGFPHSIRCASFTENVPLLPAQRLLAIPHETPHSRPLSTAVLPQDSSSHPYLWPPLRRKTNLLGWGLLGGEWEQVRKNQGS